MKHAWTASRGLVAIPFLAIILAFTVTGTSPSNAGGLGKLWKRMSETPEERMAREAVEARNVKFVYAEDIVTDKILERTGPLSYRALFVKPRGAYSYKTVSAGEVVNLAVLDALRTHGVSTQLVNGILIGSGETIVSTNWTCVPRLNEYESHVDWAARGLALGDSLDRTYRGLTSESDTVRISGLRYQNRLRYDPDIKQLLLDGGFIIVGDVRLDPDARIRSTLPCGHFSSFGEAGYSKGWGIRYKAAGCVEPAVVMRWQQLNLTGGAAIGLTSNSGYNELDRDREKYTNSDPYVGLDYDLQLVIAYIWGDHGKQDPLESFRAQVAEVAAGSSPECIRPPKLFATIEVVGFTLRPTGEVPVVFYKW